MPLMMVVVLLLASSSNSNTNNTNVAQGFGRKTHVKVNNFLDNDLDLTLHCKSADDDLGVQILRYDQNFEWSFVVNVFGTTLFYCSFQWEGEFHHFDIYKAERDFFLCEDCIWSIKQDRPCRLDLALGNFSACYPWNQ
ncbi:leguminosin group486 secreted peptide [Senna tora]|uniref:S-protein homolog n=1 Tax=Senna tora TaxID=362788 RepID=A0A834W8U2_9FABA|nr:leguminosin group486 secreted peptide [Senna tora]